MRKISPLKPYQSAEWLKLQHYSRKKSIDEIANMCSVSSMTIRRAMERFGIRIAN